MASLFPWENNEDDSNNKEEVNPFAAFAYCGERNNGTTNHVQIQYSTNNTHCDKIDSKKRTVNTCRTTNSSKKKIKLEQSRNSSCSSSSGSSSSNNVNNNIVCTNRVNIGNGNAFKLFLEQLEAIASYRERKNGSASVDNFRKYLDEKAETKDQGIDGLFHGVIAIILSTQCLDKVALPAAKIFEKKFQTIQSCHDANIEDIEDAVKTVNFKNNKAKFTKGVAKMLLEDFDGKVPSGYRSLIKLPGVGPKIAHLIRSVLFHIDDTGVVVDSNVYRVSKRIGWGTKEMGSNELSKALATWWPKGTWAKSTQNVVGFGQLVCTTKKPKCTICPLKNNCTYSLSKRFG
jgi:endonuclease III